MKIKYKICLLRKEFDSIRLIKVITKKTIENVEKVMGNKTISLNIQQPTYIQNNIVYYFVDIDENAQMFFNKSQMPLTSNELDLAISNKMLKEIIAAESINAKEKLINMLIGFVFGAMLVGIIALFWITTNQNDIMDSLIDGTINNGGVIT